MRRSIALALAAGLAGASLASPATVRANEAGEKAFKKHCAACHTIEAGKNRVGPSLNGVVGRTAGQISGFKYSDANAKSGAVLDEKYLNAYLADPKATMPGNKMVFTGVKNDQERAALIEYLKGAK